MIFSANMKIRKIEDDENREYTYAEFMDLFIKGKVDDYTMKTQRLIEYDGDWDELEAFYRAESYLYAAHSKGVKSNEGN